MEMNTLFAYLDPGTLTFLMQCLVAIVVSCSLSLGIFWSKIKEQYDRLFSQKKNAEPTSATESVSIAMPSNSSDTDSQTKRNAA